MAPAVDKKVFSDRHRPNGSGERRVDNPEPCYTTYVAPNLESIVRDEEVLVRRFSERRQSARQELLNAGVEAFSVCSLLLDTIKVPCSDCTANKDIPNMEWGVTPADDANFFAFSLDTGFCRVIDPSN